MTDKNELFVSVYDTRRIRIIHKCSEQHTYSSNTVSGMFRAFEDRNKKTEINHRCNMAGCYYEGNMCIPICRTQYQIDQGREFNQP
jgi:hypothetical protein